MIDTVWIERERLALVVSELDAARARIADLEAAIDAARFAEWHAKTDAEVDAAYTALLAVRNKGGAK